jgi:hypothetical protein
MAAETNSPCQLELGNLEQIVEEKHHAIDAECVEAVVDRFEELYRVPTSLKRAHSNENRPAHSTKKSLRRASLPSMNVFVQRELVLRW